MPEFTKYRERGAYHWQWYAENTFGYREQVDFIVRQFPRSGSVLDVGCGDGLIAYKLFRRGLAVTGIDPERLSIDLGYDQIGRAYRRRSPWSEVLRRLQQRDVRTHLARRGLVLRPQSIYELGTHAQYEYALCHEVIEHVPEPERLIATVAAVTRRFALFTTPNGATLQPGKEDYQFWDPAGFLQLFGQRHATMVVQSEERLCVRLDIQRVEREPGYHRA